uniref:Uncharacterized protein n=1 Tax=Brugia malayi TaxID=6279 RepID=A8NIU6_BRUMA
MVPRAGNMSSIIIRTADQTKRRLCEVLNEIKRLNLDSVDQMTTTDETIRLHQERRRITQEKNHAYPNIHRGVGIGQYRVETIHPADFSLNQKKRRRRSIPSDKR